MYSFPLRYFYQETDTEALSDVSINPAIFREYDIRGITGKDIDEEVFELIGKAYGTYMKKLGASSISMGRDCRVTSPELSQALIRQALMF